MRAGTPTGGAEDTLVQVARWMRGYHQAAGDETFRRLLDQGVPEAIDQALADLASFPR